MRRLLKALWPYAALRGAVTFWLNPSKRSYHLSLDEVPGLTSSDEQEFGEFAGDRNVYFGLGLRRVGLDEKRQGGKKDIIAMPGVALDIDFFDPRAHAADNLPQDLDEALVLISHLPDPGAIVYTGNGAHVYWFFSEPLLLDTSSRRTQAQRAYKAFQEPIIKQAKDQGWHLDNTASIQRVWRVPGFVNQKTSKPVKLAHCDPSWRCDLQSLGVKMPSRRSVVSIRPTRDLNPALDPLRDALRRVGPNNRFYASIQAALRGQSMAPRGERDETLQGVCSTIAWLPEGRTGDPEELAEILRSSLQRWAEEEGATKTVEDELRKASDKIERSQEDYWEKQKSLSSQLRGIASALGVRREDEENEFLLKHALIQYRSTFYAFDFRRGEYSKPRTREEIIPLVRDAWADGPDGLSIYYTNEKEQRKTKTIARICEEYCTVVDEAIGDMTLQESRFSIEDNTFYEAMARRRVIEERFDPQIDEWLHLLAGDKYDKVCDWIAAVPQLGCQCCALYLDGKTGAGKGMLASGLARLWRKGGATPFINVIGDYNEEIIQCPLVWIDEGVPGRKGNITAELRAIVGRSSFSCKEKYLSNRPVLGSIRMLICANNSNVLMFGDSEISTSDLEAVVGRILHVTARTEAAEWLEKNNEGGRVTKSWVEGDLLAKHCLYLCEHRKLIPGRRFLVEGDETQMHRQLAMQGETNGLVYEWLVRFATNPGQVEKAYRTKKERPLAQIGNGEILVNTQCVLDCWRLYMSEDVRRPSSTRIGKVLARLAYKTARIGSRGKRNRYHVIKSDLILEWCREQQIGNEDQIEENLKKELNDAS